MRRSILLLAAIAIAACARGSNPEFVREEGMVLDGSVDAATFGDQCFEMTIRVKNTVPTVRFLIDQSASMGDALAPDGTRKWDAMRAAVTSVVSKFEGQVQFGATLFNSTTGFASDRCPTLSSTPALALDGASAEIGATLLRANPAGDTPTGESMELVTANLAPLDTEGPKFIVLATDGEADTCAMPDDFGLGRDTAVLATELAFARGVATMVLAVGTGTTEATLRALANAGSGLPTDTVGGAPIYRALNPDALNAQLDRIIHGVRNCTFALEHRVRGTDKSSVSLTVGSAPARLLERNGPNGWHLIGDSAVSLDGAACDDLLSAKSASVHVVFPCAFVLR